MVLFCFGSHNVFLQTFMHLKIAFETSCTTVFFPQKLFEACVRLAGYCTSFPTKYISSMEKNYDQVPDWINTLLLEASYT